MLSAYVAVLLCMIELLAFVAFRNTTLSFYFISISAWPFIGCLFALFKFSSKFARFRVKVAFTAAMAAFLSTRFYVNHFSFDLYYTVDSFDSVYSAAS